MHTHLSLYPESKPELYALLREQLSALMDDTLPQVSNLANASALLYDALSNLNWAGFYLMHEGALVLGPFQGKTACTRIAVGKGVCGTAVAEKRIQLVPDVHAFPGHIACDSASNSEIVLPVFDQNGSVAAVLDIDSPLLARFDEQDAQGLNSLVSILEKTCFQLK